MLVEAFLGGRVRLHHGDCREVLAGLSAGGFDACVTDPPYGLGFMGKGWDHGVPDEEFWCGVLRVLKPGGWLVAMGGTRTYHRLACAIEDAGFEIRDTISWLYGSGFPKSHDVSKGIDRAAGAERKKVRHENPRNPKATGSGRDGMTRATRPWIERAMENGYHEMDGPEPATAAARQWDGWGTALKPACELIVLARKPLSEGTVAANVLRWGTGAINVDGCRVAGAFESGWSQSGSKAGLNTCMSGPNYARDPKPDNANGRWPANVVHDGSEEVVGAFPDAPGQLWDRPKLPKNSNGIYGDFGEQEHVTARGDSGSAARFFYTSKADADDRLGSKHPTVKPLDLMQWLVRLVTPPRGVVLDPFAGTGTTGEAAWREGMSAVLIEAKADYCNDIRRRMGLVLSGPDERAREAIKAKNLPRDDGPLFAARESWADMWARPFDFTKLDNPPG